MEGFNAKAVLRQTGLSAETLRAWERRYGAVRPKRTDTGRRFYTPGEIQRLKALAELVRRGLAIGRIAREPDDKLLALLAQTESAGGPVAAGPDSERSDGIMALLEALQAYDLNRIRAGIARVRYLSSAREFALGLVPQIMFQVGTRVDKGVLSIAQEHAISDLIGREIRSIYKELEVLDGTHQPQVRMVFATREGDHHEFGLMMAALVCRFRGVQCQYLGVNLPAKSLGEAIRALSPAAVVLGFSYVPPDEQKVSTSDFVRALDAAMPPDVEIWAGGSTAGEIERKGSSRTLWIFESITDFEQKLARRWGFPS